MRRAAACGVVRLAPLVVILLLAGCTGSTPDSPPSTTSPGSAATTSTTTPPTATTSVSPATPAGTTPPTVPGELENLGILSWIPGDITPFGQGNAPAISINTPPGTPVVSPVAGTFAGYWALPSGGAVNITPAGGQAYRIVLLGVSNVDVAPGSTLAAGDRIAQTDGASLGLATIDAAGETASCPTAHASAALRARLGSVQACLYASTPWRPDAGGPRGEDPYAKRQALLQALPSCGATPFTTSPMAPADFHGIIPLGNINPPEHTFPSDHVYFLYDRVGNATREVDVVAPADMLIYGLQEQLADRDGALNDDYAIDFAPCRDITAWFGHVSSLRGVVLDAFRNATAARPGSCQDYGDAERHTSFHVCDAAVEIHVQAGDVIGTGGGKASAALDMGARDARITSLPADVAAPARYENEKGIVCPVDLFTDPPRAALRAQLGQAGAPRTAEPICGAVFQDAPGTLAGAWFRPDVAAGDSLGPNGWNRTLMLGVDPMDGVTAVLALGGPGGALRLAFAPQHAGDVDRAFAEVTPGATVRCYQADGAAASILLRLDEATHLMLDRGSSACGAGPWSLSAAALTYIR